MSYEIRRVEEKVKKEIKDKPKYKKYIVIELLDGRPAIFDTIVYRIVSIFYDRDLADKTCEEWNSVGL